MNEKKLVTVTGASGFIALHTIRELLEKGYAVRGTVRDTGRIEGLLRSLSEYCDVTDLSFVRAELGDDSGWAEALAGADYLMHMASPLPAEAPRDENDLIIPARDGALRAIRAAVDAGVRRIVFTSSIAAISGGQDKSSVLDESHWSDTNKDIGAYPKSKTIAELAAWEFINSLPEGQKPEFAVINPGFVLGPMIDPDTSASHEVVRRLMAREVPGLPNIGFSLVDVRDVATAHVIALTHKSAPGNRYICVAESLSFREIARRLHLHLSDRNYRIPQRPVPDWLVRALALFSPTFRLIVSRLGPATKFDTSRIRQHFDWTPIPMSQSITETADSMITHKIT
ncbi:NAD-dependent epimerase/dehydratase family protein [Sneathiella litorea]|uniref:NAD-dependent epimerase/dehydratase family protein n=1 Tax=Sneathiella litorea TaxID=2606216 RepID=A0A6L8W7Z0_9PROT|nr:NAD-dependent epimerase/dehydratase family protein [Sneathiella litorea]MZR31236.1 NAD-dependent epimerase/dehydratase family protein [Sneathiella litorea]